MNFQFYRHSPLIIIIKLIPNLCVYIIYVNVCPFWGNNNYIAASEYLGSGRRVKHDITL